ncbi:uncharacterized protein FOMMEDRAFT_160153 [Fomitiporia mediterranea MF3/22]|uniref:uncharacterized protein n=1 Tax=Fomitiporia mediterranea (strain MF3/22) TaxID=694068 RepID=UPI0004407CDA|nr:uncharacterized protein FOMMEDRAFT_160153 [Fomitiporia mediterranea MF3/22]EJC99721.1 hypothetical protein FOMMEDRAFT_160153 [Fomitiporia mediterranea MF3/22]
MSSETPPMPHSSTKYEDIPPRFRKVWIKGHAESVQKRLDTPIEEFSFSIPLHRSTSDSHLREAAANRASRSLSSSSSKMDQSSSKSLSAHQERLKSTDSLLFDKPGSRSGESALPEQKKDQSSIPIAYSGPSSMRHIISTVVGTNVARSTPPTSRSSSPLGKVRLHSKYRQSSQSRSATRANSPITDTRASTPIPSGWIPLTSRHSLRRFDIRPWGPRHLEYDYSEARKEFQGAAYYALGQYGYVPPRGVTKFKAPPPEELPSMSDLREVPEFAKACRRLDAADRALEEALGRGETWENTPIPEDYLKFSLERLIPDDFCTSRPDNVAMHKRSRSSVTLEEAAGEMKTSTFAQSSTPSVSTSISGPVSDRDSDPIGAVGGGSSTGTPSLAQMTLTDEQAPPTVVRTDAVALDSVPTQTGTLIVPVSMSSEASHITSATGSSTAPSRILHKRPLQEIFTDDTTQDSRKRISLDGASPRELPPRSSSPVPALRLTEPTNRQVFNWLGSDTTSAYDSGSGFSGNASAIESPPTSVSTSTPKRARSTTRGGGRVSGMRGRRRGGARR